MEQKKYRPQGHEFIFPLVFLIMGLFLAIFITKTYIDDKNFYSIAEHTTATVEDVESYKSGGKHKHTYYRAYVNYTVDGKEYNGRISGLSRSRAHVDTMPISYDPNNPYLIKYGTDTSNDAGTIAGAGVGVLFTIIGFVMLIYLIKDIVVINRLLRDNNYTVCDNYNIIPSNISVNKVRYNCAEGTFYAEGREYKCKSKPFHPRKNPYEKGGSYKVYYRKDKPDENFFSTEVGNTPIYDAGDFSYADKF